MPVILNRLPIPERDTLAFIGAEQVRLRADQIILWVSLAVRDTLTATREMPRFPVLIDTGMNHYLALQERPGYSHSPTYQALRSWPTSYPIALPSLAASPFIRTQAFPVCLFWVCGRFSTTGFAYRCPATNEVRLYAPHAASGH